MNKFITSLKYNKSTTAFNALKITLKGVSFISYDAVPPLLVNAVTPQRQKHVIRIELRLESNNLISTQMMSIDSDSDKEQALLWQGYKICFNGLSGYTDTEVKFEIEKVPYENVKRLKRGKGEVVTEFDKRSITAVLTYKVPVKVFDAFSITLNGIKQSSVKTKPGSKHSSYGSLSKETASFSLSGLGESHNASMVLYSSEPGFEAQPLIWQGYKFSYAGKEGEDKLFFLIEEIPE